MVSKYFKFIVTSRYKYFRSYFKLNENGGSEVVDSTFLGDFITS